VNETLLQYWNKVKQYWNRYSKKQKITFIAIIVLLVLSVGIISINLSKTQYSLAFTDLQPSDAAAIKGYLDTAKIPYNLSADGKSIEVPTNQVASVKLGVESQGLNKNGSLGFGAFRQNSSFGMTDNEFKVKYVDAIQGELQQLINSNQAIGSSKVLISLPETGPFLKPQEEMATASVVLQIKSGYTLDQGKVDTIYNLVSHSIKNLPIENITLSDQYGENLSSSKVNGGQSSSGLVSGQFDINNQFRNDLQRNITKLLGTMLGPDKIIVSVFSTMNFDQKKSTENLVSAPNQVDQKGLEISLNEASKSYTSDGGAASGGVPGTGTTDVPGYPGSSGSGKTNSEETSKTVNSEVNRIKNDIVSTPYVLKDLSINVGIEPPNKDDPTSLTSDTKTAVQDALVNIVRSALADNKVTYTDAELTKKVTVIAHSFVRPSDGGASKTQTYLTYGGLALAALALGGLGVFFMMRRRRAQQLEAEMAAVPAKVELPTIDIENVTNDNQVRKQLETLAKKKPEDFVNLLRTWLVDE
jgi:flagellar M-ring protein FliF